MRKLHDSRARPTILVVDDMAFCRESISEILRSKGFEAVPAASGEDALAALKSRSVDLILLDLVMPGMDGFAVLKALRRDAHYRDLPVIMLTDHAQVDAVREAASSGVQGYLLKAHFTSDELFSRIQQQLSSSKCSQPIQGPSSLPERASPSPLPARTATSTPASPPLHSAQQTSSARGTRNKAEVLQAVRRQLDLRPVPPVLHHVVSQTHSASSSIHEVVDTLRQDQALALRVMKVANSSFYAAGKRAQNLIEAAGRIGMSGIRNAVVTVVAIDHFGSASEAGLVPQRFWEHSLATAALAKSLGETLGAEDAEDLFLAGLLHDLGRLALSNAFPDDYREMLGTASRENAGLGSLERAAFGLSHSEVTKEALAHLGMPPNVVSAAALHDRTAEQLKRAGPDAQSALIVALADRLAHALAIGDSGDPVLLSTEEYIEALGIDARTVRTIGEQVAKGISDVELLYACHGDAQFREPLTTELAKGAGQPMSITVLNQSAPGDPVSLFLEQLGWLCANEPQVAVLPCGSDEQFKAGLRELKTLEQGLNRRVGVLVVQTDPSVDAPLPSAERRCEIIQLPVRYRALLKTIEELHETPTAASVTADG